MAIYNLLYLIPFIYLIHTVLSFHILEKIKINIYKEEKDKMVEKLNNCIILPKLYDNLSSTLEKKCTFNPISPQGMLIFGLISSLYSSIYYHKSIIIK